MLPWWVRVQRRGRNHGDNHGEDHGGELALHQRRHQARHHACGQRQGADRALEQTRDMDGAGAAGGGQPLDWTDADVVGRFVARARRIADLSQRGMAEAVGVGRSSIGQLESGARLPSLPLLAAILQQADLRLAVVDGQGNEVNPVARDGVRDRAGRRLPIHHDVASVLEAPGWVARADWRFDQNPGDYWSVRGDDRDERRARLGDHVSLVRDHHPSPAAIAHRVALSRRYPRVTVSPVPQPLRECTCLDDCFERTCLDACTCRCEAH